MPKITEYKKSCVEQRQFMLKEFKSGCKSGREMYQKLLDAFKDQETPPTSIKSVYFWLKRFKAGQFDVDDRPRCGRPQNLDDTRIFEAIGRDPLISTTDLYLELNIKRNAIRATLQRAGLVNVNIMWVPAEISPEQRQERIDLSAELVQRHESDPFLGRVIFEGEKFITYNKYKRHFKTKNAKKVLRPNQSAVDLEPHRVVLHIWWTIRGLIMYKLLGEENRTQEYYLEALDELKAQVMDQTTNPVQPDKPWILFSNRNHFYCNRVKEKLIDFGWEHLMNPQNSPDIDPTVYHILQKFQLAFNTTTFTKLEEVENFTFKYFETRRSSFYEEPLEILPEKWHRIIETEGEYIATNEKL